MHNFVVQTRNSTTDRSPLHYNITSATLGILFIQTDCLDIDFTITVTTSYSPFLINPSATLQLFTVVDGPASARCRVLFQMRSLVKSSLLGHRLPLGRRVSDNERVELPVWARMPLNAGRLSSQPIMPRPRYIPPKQSIPSSGRNSYGIH